MLLNPVSQLVGGPPPQSVLDRRPAWYVLIFLLGLVAALRIITLDIIGGMLSILLLIMAWMMISDGMREMPRYALIFGVLNVLCLFFDTIPLVASLQGRSQVITEPSGREPTEDGGVRAVYSVTVKTTPFFDAKEGFVYNCTSLQMVIAPVTMLLGAYLSLSAHSDLSRGIDETQGDEATWYQTVFAAQEEALQERRPLVGAAGANDDGAEASREGTARPSGERGNAEGSRQTSGYTGRFTGTPHKLSDAPAPRGTP